jgi:hypothetical protein
MVKAHRFIKIYEDIYKRGGSNISIKINGKDYFFRMFDSKLTPREIKEKVSCQKYRILENAKKAMAL